MSLPIAPGEAWGVIGTSGSGKTTLLNLMLEPALLLLDEPFSALDPTLGGHLLTLLLALKGEGIALLMASHDLEVVRRLCDQLLVLREGVALCQGPAGQLLSDPPHPHLRELLEAGPRLPVG